MRSGDESRGENRDYMVDSKQVEDRTKVQETDWTKRYFDSTDKKDT